MTELKQKLDKTAERFKSEISSLRTGRATPAMVENLEIDYYGTKTPLKALAAISVPEAKQLLIQPWDKTLLPVIEKTVQSSSLGFNPAVDRDVIRISFPPLTEERRKELIKILNKHLEEARIAVRREREEAVKELERREKAKEMSEDEMFRGKNEIQKLVEETNKKIADICAVKEKEITSV